MTDLLDASRTRLWSTAGGWSAETAISWAPDGSTIAATYLTQYDEFATVVIGADGDVRCEVEGVVILPASNGTWTGDGSLLYVDDDFNLAVVNVDNGSHDQLARVQNRSASQVR